MFFSLQFQPEVLSHKRKRLLIDDNDFQESNEKVIGSDRSELSPYSQVIEGARP